MELEKNLRKETEKWLDRIKNEMEKTELLDESKKHMLTNIKAYIKDCEIFLKQDKLIMAFEAVLWAWAIFETLKNLNIILSKKDIE